MNCPRCNKEMMVLRQTVDCRDILIYYLGFCHNCLKLCKISFIGAEDME